MRVSTTGASALALLVATGCVYGANAQESQQAQQPAPPQVVSPEVVELPGLVVEEAPAKRNVKKAKLRKGATTT